MDFNLLTALDALLEDNSVVGAAARLHLTPPAVSRTLARIRHVTGDDILVRAGRTMLPTPYAVSIRQQVHALVQEAASVLRPGRALDPATLDRVFTLRGHDALLAAAAPALIESMSVSAPGVRLRFLGEVATENPDTMRNEVDLELGATPPERPEISHELVGADRLVVAMRRGHPFSRKRLSPQHLGKLTHLNVSRRGRMRDRVDDALAEIGLARRVVASLPTAAAALEVVARTDFVVLVAGTLCSALCGAFDVVTRPIPLDLPSIPVALSWHRRFDSDVAHQWMRRLVAARLAAQLEEGV